MILSPKYIIANVIQLSLLCERVGNDSTVGFIKLGFILKTYQSIAKLITPSISAETPGYPLLNRDSIINFVISW